MDKLHDYIQHQEEEHQARLHELEAERNTTEARRFQAWRAEGIPYELARTMALLVAEKPAWLQHPEDELRYAAALRLLREKFGGRDFDILVRAAEDTRHKARLRWDWVVNRVRRDIERRHNPRPRKRRRLHARWGTLTPEQRQQAEYLWKSGANHDLSWVRAYAVRPEVDFAVYQRVERLLQAIKLM